MLLHVVAAARGVNLAMDAGSGLDVSGGFDVVDDFAVLAVGHFGDPKFGIGIGSNPAGVEDLAAAGGIKRRAIKNQRGAWVVDHFAHFGVEVVEKRVVVIEAVGHGRRLF